MKLKKYKIKWKNLRTGDWDEDTIESRKLSEALEEAKQAWFDTNDPAYDAEEIF